MVNSEYGYVPANEGFLRRAMAKFRGQRTAVANGEFLWPNNPICEPRSLAVSQTHQYEIDVKSEPSDFQGISELCYIMVIISLAYIKSSVRHIVRL